MPRVGWSGVALALLVLAACAPAQPAPDAPSEVPGSSAPQPAEATSMPGRDPSVAVDSPVWALGVMVAPQDMPLTKYRDSLRLAEEHEQSLPGWGYTKEWWDQSQAFMAKCMKEKGFLYYPTEFPADDENGEWANVLRMRDAETLPIPTLHPDRAVVEARGYGVMSTHEKMRERPVDDQNEEYIASLSAEQLAQYEIATIGQSSQSADYNPYKPIGGCMGETEKAHPDPTLTHSGTATSDVFFDLVVDLIEFGSDPPMESDPRLVKLNAEWRECMTAAGVSTEALRARTTSVTYLDGPTGAFRLAVQTGADGGFAEDPFAANTPDDQRSLVGSQPEIAIALADFDCRASTDYVERIIAVQREWEEEFIASHKKQLDELLAHVDQLVG